MSEEVTSPSKSLLDLPESDCQHLTTPVITTPALSTPVRGRSFKVKNSPQKEENIVSDNNIEMVNSKLRKISDDRDRAAGETIDAVSGVKVEITIDKDE